MTTITQFNPQQAYRAEPLSSPVPSSALRAAPQLPRFRSEVSENERHQETLPLCRDRACRRIDAGDNFRRPGRAGRRFRNDQRESGREEEGRVGKGWLEWGK